MRYCMVLAYAYPTVVAWAELGKHGAGALLHTSIAAIHTVALRVAKVVIDCACRGSNSTTTNMGRRRKGTDVN